MAAFKVFSKDLSNGKWLWKPEVKFFFPDSNSHCISHIACGVVVCDSECVPACGREVLEEGSAISTFKENLAMKKAGLKFYSRL